MASKNNKFVSGIVYISILYFVFGLGNYIARVENDRESNYSYVVTSEDSDEILNKLQEELNIDSGSIDKDKLLMLNAIYENSNLSNDEKNLFYGFYSVIDDIKEMDKNKAYSALAKVDVNYTYRGEGVSLNTLGDYNYRTGTINIYTKNDSSNAVLLHEGIHCLFNNESTDDLPRGFSEGMTELLTNEYFSSDPFLEDKTYPYEVSYVKMLLELLGRDKVMMAFAAGNMNLIYNELDKYNDTSYSAFKILDIYEDSFDEGDRYSTSDKWKAYDSMKSIYMKMHPSLENQNEFNYFYELSASIFEESPSEFYSQYMFYYGVLEKAYISEELKSQFPKSNFVNYSDRHNNVSNNKVLQK